MTSATEILQHGWLWSIVLSVATISLVWFGARLVIWLLVGIPLLAGFTLLSGVAPVGWILAWLVFGAGVLVLGVPPIRQALLSERVFRYMRQSLPTLSDSERELVNAGGTGWERSLFEGRPDWRALRKAEADTPLGEAERAYLEGSVEALCAQLDDYRINHELNGLSPAAWESMRRERVFGVGLAAADGGHGFSPSAQSAVLLKLASRSISAALVAMPPNFAQPARLIERFGTADQRRQLLPAISAGETVICLALTGPEAGSDATAIADLGVVARSGDDEDVLGVRLDFDKRYVPLAPVAKLILLAFRLEDPDGLLEGDGGGITLALVPADTPGVVNDQRHDLQQLGFPSGPVRGKGVFVPLDAILGGREGIGQGWSMLLAGHSDARGIVVPALTCAAAKTAARLTGAYARVRYQFRGPIARFEGVQEALAVIAGNTFAMEATRELVLAELERGGSPAVATAVVKYNLTERCRLVLERAMDIHAGAGLCLGPRNLIGEIAKFPRVAVTLQGANIMTRSQVAFGQGIIRCHPCLRDEIMAAGLRGRAGLGAFDKAFARHLRLACSHALRSLLLGLTGARLAAAPRGSRPNGRYYRQLSRLAAAFALSTDVVIFTLRGSLKRRGRLAGRMADVLGELYLGSAVLRHHALSGGRETGDRALLEWALRDSLVRAQAALEGVCRNLPNRWVGRLLRRILFPLGRAWRPVDDAVESRLADMLTVPSTARDRLTAGIYHPLAKDDPLARLEAALGKLSMTAGLEARLHAGAAMDLLGDGQYPQRIAAAVAARVLTPAEGDELLAAEAARREALQVDAFPTDETESEQR